MNILICICLVIVVYWRARNMYYKRLTREYQFKLYKLRDELRTLAIDGKIDSKYWMFNYIDTSISKTISVMDNMNLFFLFLVAKKNNKNNKIESFKSAVTVELQKNSCLNDIYIQYGNLNVDFLIKKHYWLMFSMKCVYTILLSLKFIKSIHNKIVDNALSLRVYPETSTSLKFAH